jgi:hypothetical protein
MTSSTDQATFNRDLEGLTCDGYLLRCNFARVPLAILKRSDLSAGAVRVYALMLWYLHKGATYPGHAAAAAEFHIPLRTLKRHLAELTTHAVLLCRRHGRGNANSYHFPDPRLPGTTHQEVPDVALHHPMMGHSVSDDGPDLALVSTTTRGTDSEESLLSPPTNLKQGPAYDAALAQLDQVKADVNTLIHQGVTDVLQKHKADQEADQS